ncbi:hypothetical protein B0H10DRAFT_1963233 [Mycena sp. CBHHK59/15]|nr:hypothetical protein B0H10DRAFT_1963233 [Mycena sp. CBHHK59/15]
MNLGKGSSTLLPRIKLHPLQCRRSATSGTHLLVPGCRFPQGSSPFSEGSYLSLAAKDAHSGTHLVTRDTHTSNGARLFWPTATLQVSLLISSRCFYKAQVPPHLIIKYCSQLCFDGHGFKTLDTLRCLQNPRLEIQDSGFLLQDTATGFVPQNGAARGAEFWTVPRFRPHPTFPPVASAGGPQMRWNLGPRFQIRYIGLGPCSSGLDPSLIVAPSADMPNGEKLTADIIQQLSINVAEAQDK